MEINLLDRMLNAYMDGQTPLAVTLHNNIRVLGKIKAFDSYVIVMEGNKREIVYRHAVTEVIPQIQDALKRQPMVNNRPAPAKTAPPKAARTPARKPGPAQPQSLSASATEQSLSNTMKDGLLKWMMKQEAGK